MCVNILKKNVYVSESILIFHILNLPREPQVVELLHSVFVSEHHLAVLPKILHDITQLHALQFCRPDYIPIATKHVCMYVQI